MTSTQTNLMLPGLMALRLSIAEIRPTVPTTICGRSFSCRLSSGMSVPPTERWVVTTEAAAEAETSAYIACAASRVGFRMIAWVRLTELSNSLTITFDIISVFPGNP